MICIIVAYFIIVAGQFGIISHGDRLRGHQVNEIHVRFRRPCKLFTGLSILHSGA